MVNRWLHTVCFIYFFLSKCNLFPNFVVIFHVFFCREATHFVTTTYSNTLEQTQLFILPRLQKKKKSRFDFDDELKIVDVRYNNKIKITIKVQLVFINIKINKVEDANKSV